MSLSIIDSKYEGIISGRTQKVFIGVGAAILATAATGGLAVAFAPQIAIVLAGEAVAGLHGAALTSASLAYIGGGALAANGLGMAGGTAVITGGGALLGLASSGTASMAAILSTTSSEYWVRQCSKLITFCSFVLDERLNDNQMVAEVASQIEIIKNRLKQFLGELDAENNDLDKDIKKRLSEDYGYIERTHKELQRIIRKKGS